MNLLKQLIENSNIQEDAFFYFSEDTLFTPYENRKGLPLGNQTSQFFGNIYLNSFDHYVKEVLQVKAYIRYVDDMMFFSNSKESLAETMQLAKNYLDTFRLKIHPLKIKLLPTIGSFIFLGHKVYKTHFRVTSKGIRRARRKLRKVHFDVKHNRLEHAMAKNRIFGTIGYLKMGNNFRVCEELLSQTVLLQNHLRRQ